MTVSSGKDLMAIRKCRECGHQVSTTADACPSCGAKRSKGSGGLGVLILILLIVGIIVVERVPHEPTGSPMPTTPSAPAAEPARSPAPAVAPAAKPALAKMKAGYQWSYLSAEDSMAKGFIRQARVQSSNQVLFSFPYNGPQRGTLTLRTHPRFGKGVILVLERGQFLCPSFDDSCSVLVRFDDEPAARYSAASPEDDSTEVLFITDYARFFEKLTKAKRVRISAKVFQEGSPVFDFDVSGFDAQRYKGATSTTTRQAADG